MSSKHRLKERSIAYYLVYMYCRLWERRGTEKGIGEGRRRREYGFKNIIESEKTSVGLGEGTEE